MNAFKSQQARWAKGLMQTAKKILPRVLRSDVPAHVKGRSRFSSHREHQLSVDGFLSMHSAAGDDRAFLSGLVSDAGDRSAAVPGVDAARFRLSIWRPSARCIRKTWKRTFLYLPFVMAVGIGLSVRNAMAVMEAIFGVKSEFVRTPKYSVEAGAKNAGAWAKKTYRKSAGWMPFAEVLLGLYFAAGVVYAMQNENYATVPFLLLFVWGYLYTGLMSLAQTYIGSGCVFSVESGEVRPASTGDRGSSLRAANVRSRRVYPAKLAGIPEQRTHCKLRMLAARGAALVLAVFALSLSLRRRVFRSPSRNTKLVAPSFARSSMGPLVIFGYTRPRKTPPKFAMFFQEPNFYYLTGHDEPDAASLLLPETVQPGEAKGPREILYLPPRDSAQEKWEGPKMGPDDPGIASKDWIRSRQILRQSESRSRSPGENLRERFTPSFRRKVEDGYPHFTNAT